MWQGETDLLKCPKNLSLSHEALPDVASSYFQLHLHYFLPHTSWFCNIYNTEHILYSSSADVIFFSWKTLSTLPYFQLIISNCESQNRSLWSSHSPVPISHPLIQQDLPGWEVPHCVIMIYWYVSSLYYKTLKCWEHVIYFSIFVVSCFVFIFNIFIGV